MKMKQCFGFVALLFAFGLGIASEATDAVADDRTTCDDGGNQAAVEACTRLIQSGRLRSSELAIAYDRRGRVYASKGDYDRAIREYDQAIRLAPNLPSTLSNRGLAYAKEGNFDNAIRDFDQAIRLDPHLHYAFHNRGVAYYRNGDYERAIRDYDQAIRLNPNFVIAFRGRGEAYNDRGDYDR